MRARRRGVEPGGAVVRAVDRAVVRVGEEEEEGRSELSSAEWSVADEKAADSASSGERMARSSAGKGGVLYVSACAALIAASVRTASASWAKRARRCAGRGSAETSVSEAERESVMRCRARAAVHFFLARCAARVGDRGNRAPWRRMRMCSACSIRRAGVAGRVAEARRVRVRRARETWGSPPTSWASRAMDQAFMRAVSDGEVEFVRRA